MRPSGKKSVYISIPEEDAETLNAIAWRSKRTRSEIVLEALRSYYPAVNQSYQRRLEGRNELNETGEGNEESWSGPDWAKHVSE